MAEDMYDYIYLYLVIQADTVNHFAAGIFMGALNWEYFRNSQHHTYTHDIFVTSSG